MKVFLTGATGFIGSHILTLLVNKGFAIYATYRSNSIGVSQLLKSKNLVWVDINQNDWQKSIGQEQLDLLIHTAWPPADFVSRNNWEIQHEGFLLSKNIFDFAKRKRVGRIIAFGSQAEYGVINKITSESVLPNPVDAYGVFKLVSQKYLQQLFNRSKIDWAWVRVYSIYGEGENTSWLLPSVIRSLNKSIEIELTGCDQKYNYLYIDDFIQYLYLIASHHGSFQGIYNICADETISLKKLLIKTAAIMDRPSKLLKFGSLKYRNGQSMIMNGSNNKFKTKFLQEVELVGFEEGLYRTVKYYTEGADAGI